MSLCLNPDCSYRNAPTDQFCQKCGSKLLFRERYRAIKLIGQGGFGRTFQAVDEDKPSKPYCVIKQFFPSAQGTETLQKAAELFKEEAVRLDSLGKHPQIPELYAYFTGSDNRQYLVQEYIEGQNLEQELKEWGTFNEEKIRHLLGDILPVLEFIHANQVIHRDIKPANIIRRNGDNRLALVDFGASKLVTPLNRVVTGTIIGSAEYAAPEQANGKAVNASDLYSLGVTCLYLVTGVSPFDLFDAGEHEWIWRQYLGNNPVTYELSNILDKLIEFGTKRRYQSAGEVLQAMNLRSQVTPTFTQSQMASDPPIQFFTFASGKGFNYQKLESLLKQQMWQEADLETTKIMFQISNRQDDEWLRVQDITNFPSEVLRSINWLWLTRSYGRFSFSIQAKIYRDLGGTKDYDEEIWKQFGDKVGWRKHYGLSFLSSKDWIYYKDVIFNRTAPEGHLPLLLQFFGGRVGTTGYRTFVSLLSRQEL